MKDKLGDIGEKVSSIDLVRITLNGIKEGYQMFIIGLGAREKATTFEELIRVLIQEEERHKNLNPQNADLALVANNKFFKGKLGGGHKYGGSSEKNPFQGMSFTKNYLRIKCFYCGITVMLLETIIRKRMMKTYIDTRGIHRILLVNI